MQTGVTWKAAALESSRTRVDLYEQGVNFHVINKYNIEGFWSFNLGKFWIQYCRVIRDSKVSMSLAHIAILNFRS